MRIDRLLCFLRFVRTRSAAQALVEAGHIRRNGERVTRCSTDVLQGDILTLPLGGGVRLVEIIDLPERRGPPREAQTLYRELDPHKKSDIAPEQDQILRGKPHQ